MPRVMHACGTGTRAAANSKATKYPLFFSQNLPREYIDFTKEVRADPTLPRSPDFAAKKQRSDNAYNKWAMDLVEARDEAVEAGELAFQLSRNGNYDAATRSSIALSCAMFHSLRGKDGVSAVRCYVQRAIELDQDNIQAQGIGQMLLFAPAFCMRFKQDTVMKSTAHASAQSSSRSTATVNTVRVQPG